MMIFLIRSCSTPFLLLCLAAKGIAYAKALAKFLNELHIDNLTLWTSALNRTRETAKFVNLFSEQYGVRRKHIIFCLRIHISEEDLLDSDRGFCAHSQLFRRSTRSSKVDFSMRLTRARAPA